MAVPNTTTFSLQDVQTELGGVNDDLIECFANANPSGFDPLYEGSKNSLLNFRNYNHVLLPSFGVVDDNGFVEGKSTTINITSSDKILFAVITNNGSSLGTVTFTDSQSSPGWNELSGSGAGMRVYYSTNLSNIGSRSVGITISNTNVLFGLATVRNSSTDLTNTQTGGSFGVALIQADPLTPTSPNSMILSFLTSGNGATFSSFGAGQSSEHEKAVTATITSTINITTEFTGNTTADTQSGTVSNNSGHKAILTVEIKPI